MAISVPDIALVHDFIAQEIMHLRIRHVGGCNGDQSYDGGDNRALVVRQARSFFTAGQIMILVRSEHVLPPCKTRDGAESSTEVSHVMTNPEIQRVPKCIPSRNQARFRCPLKRQSLSLMTLAE